MSNDLQGFIDQYLKWLTSHGYSSLTVKAYRADLSGLREWVEFKESQGLAPTFPNLMTTDPTTSIQLSRIVETTFAEYLTDGRGEWMPRTTIRKTASLRGFGRWIFDNERFLASYRVPTPAEREADPVPGGLQRVMVLIGDAPLVHHRRLLVLCGMLGLRVSEARSVVTRDFLMKYDPVTNDHTDCWLRVIGKGDKERQLPVNSMVQGLLEMDALDDGPNDFVLVPVCDRAARSYLNRRGIHSHQLRSTFATTAYEQTQDPAAVQKLMGHASMDTTMPYIQVGKDALRRAADIV